MYVRMRVCKHIIRDWETESILNEHDNYDHDGSLW